MDIQVYKIRDFSDQNTHVVILFGWLGSKNFHMKRYIDQWSKPEMHVHTIVTVRFKTAIKAFIQSKQYIKGQIESINDQVENIGLSKIILHSFSRNGTELTAFYLTCSKNVDNVHAIIWDSGPGMIRMDTVFSAFGFRNRLLVKTMTCMGQPFFYLLYGKRTPIIDKMLSTHAFQIKQLFICSKTDKVVLYDEIAPYLEKCVESKVLYLDSSHVSHGKKYTTEYFNFIKSNL